MNFRVLTWLILLIAASMLSGCGSSGTSGGNGGSNLPASPPEFTFSPFQYPNGVATDLSALGIFNLSCDCDVVHVGWDFMPNWASYPDDQVPVVAVADGVISRVTLRSTNTYNGQEHNTFIVVLDVATETGVHYTFEPFVTFGETDALAWLLVSEGDAVSAGDVIGYLPKLPGNLGEGLIHLDFKVGTGGDMNDYVCPTDFFSTSWQDENVPVMLTKLNACTVLCCE
jgi:hypothetical protein